jgi:hypothetical protein
MNKILHNLAQNLNTLQKNLPMPQYGLGLKCPHAERLNAYVQIALEINALTPELNASCSGCLPEFSLSYLLSMHALRMHYIKCSVNSLLLT